MSRKPDKAAKAGKPYWEMNAEELAEATRGLENIRLEDTKPLSPAERQRWERGRRATKRGRPTVGRGAVRVFISIERDLLERADTLAGEMGIGRSQLIARGLAAMMEQAAAGEPQNRRTDGRARRTG